jgi:hypothetical protein
MSGKFITVIILLFQIFFIKHTAASFTLSAEVKRNSNLNLDLDFVSNYIKNLEIYPKYFPNITSVSKLEENLSEWVYRVEAPFSAPYDVKFVLEDKSPAPDTLLFESVDKVRDYLYCSAVLSRTGENKTKVNFLFKISMTRDKASDIHFLAGLLGEKFLSEKMKERLEGDLEEFISSAVKDMYMSYRTSVK